MRYKTQNRRKKERENKKASRHDRGGEILQGQPRRDQRDGVMTKIKLMSGGHESDGFEMTAGI